MALISRAAGSVFNDANLRAHHLCNANLNDDSGNSYNPNNPSTPAPTFVSGGKFNNAVHFVRTSTQYNGLGSDLGISNGAVTISTWVKMTSQPGAGVVYNLLYLSSTAGGNIGYWINYTNTNTISFIRCKAPSTQQGPTVNLTLTNAVWFHVALTYDLTNVCGYVNGLLVAGPTAASGNGSNTSLGTGWYFSYPAVLGGSTCLNGDLDEVIVSARAWSAAEVYNYYQQWNMAIPLGISMGTGY